MSSSCPVTVDRFRNVRRPVTITEEVAPTYRVAFSVTAAPAAMATLRRSSVTKLVSENLMEYEPAGIAAIAYRPSVAVLAVSGAPLVSISTSTVGNGWPEVSSTWPCKRPEGAVCATSRRGLTMSAAIATHATTPARPGDTYLHLRFGGTVTPRLTWSTARALANDDSGTREGESDDVRRTARRRFGQERCSGLARCQRRNCRRRAFRREHDRRRRPHQERHAEVSDAVAPVVVGRRGGRW